VESSGATYLKMLRKRALHYANINLSLLLDFCAF
jgi:hypothetical protein